MSAEDKDVGIAVDRVATATCSQCRCEVDVADLEPFVKIECPDCGHVRSVPAKLGSFLLLDLIGTGGMGGVYHAKDETLGRFVAIKVMLKSIGEDKEFVETFKREAQAAAKLNHPNIAQIYSFGQAKGQPYIVMELVAGQGFDKMVDDEKPLDQALVMEIGIQIAEGLMAADEIGLIHGDIKPENILLDEKTRAKLVDFGIATFIDQTAEGVWGTPYYIAPEKIKRQKIDARADIYSLGATLYHALAGRPPFEGETPVEVVKARLERRAKDLHLVRPDIDRGVETVISRMLELEPGMRYPTYASLMSDMRDALNALSPTKEALSTARGKGKRVVIKKKKGAGTKAGDTLATSGTVPDQTRPQAGKFVVHKGEGTIVQAGAREDEEETYEDADTEENVEKQKGRGKKAIKILLWALLIVILGAAGTGLGLYLKQKKDREIRAKRMYFTLAAEKKKAQEATGKIQSIAKNVVAMAGAAPALMAKATNAVYFVLGEKLEITKPRAKEPEKPSEMETPEDTSTEVDSGHPPPEEDTGASGEGTNAPPADKKKEAQPTATEKETDDQDSEPKADKPDAGKEKTEDKKVEQEDKPAEMPKAEPAATVAKPEVPVVEPEIKTVARSVIMHVKELSAKAREALDIETEALELKDEVLKARNPGKASATVEKLSENLSSIQTVEQEAGDALREAEEGARRVEVLRERFEKEREARRKAEEEARKRKADEQARKRAEGSRKALIENELARAEELRASSRDFSKQHKYKEAVDALKAQLPNCRTDEGKKAIELLVERYTLLYELKLFFIDRLNQDPFRWGWVQGRSAEDVLGADRQGIKLRGRTVLWSRVGTRQILHFMKRYLSSDKVGLRVLAQQNLAAAVFCDENGGAEAAARYAEKTVDLLPTLRDEVERLLP